MPEHQAVCAGDFLIWVFPNAGNPQKVQRYPREWADALRAMAATGSELFLPAHGLPIGGRERIAGVLLGVADALEQLVPDVLARMNEGPTLDRSSTRSRCPRPLERPWMQPNYDEPEFVVRNIWRLYGGWYDGNPARLKPAADSVIAAEVASLAGGVDALVARATELAAAGDLRLAAQLVEWAVQAAPDDRTPTGTGRDLRRPPGQGGVAHGPGHLRQHRRRKADQHRSASRVPLQGANPSISGSSGLLPGSLPP